MTTRARSAVLVLAAVAAVCAAASEEDLMSKTSTPIIDFTRGDETWAPINDGVMGGVSSGEMVATGGHATFRGTVSFDNNGGFSSVRSRAEVHDLSAFDGLVVRVRGDGKRFGFRLKTEASFDGVSYQVEISPPAGEWREIAVPFTGFVPVFRGRTVPGHPPLDPSRITTFGLIVSRQEGPFRIDLEWIRAAPHVAEEGLTR